MKHTALKNLALLVVLFALTLQANAQSRTMAHYRGYHKTIQRSRNDNYHFVYASVSGGYTSLDENVKGMVTTGSGGGFVGLGYEFRRTSFWLSVGGQIMMHNSKSVMDQFQIYAVGKDDEGDNATFYYDISQTDKNKWFTVGVPVMLGYYHSGFYFGFGAKFGLNFMSRSVSNSTGTYEMSAIYDDYVGTYHNIPLHGYTTYAFNEERPVLIRPHGALIGEIGYDVLSTVATHSDVCHVLKIGFYFEYGLNSVISPESSNLHTAINPSNARQVAVNPYFSTTNMADSRVAPFYLGLKVTYMFGGSRTGSTGTWHKGCQCYN